MSAILRSTFLHSKNHCRPQCTSNLRTLKFDKATELQSKVKVCPLHEVNCILEFFRMSDQEILQGSYALHNKN
jgi:hypothetical protein